MLKYGQFCPVAKAAEILGERWMLLVVRELLCGSRHYAELQRGLGRISPSVLSQRLKTLSDAKVIQRVSDSAGVCYELTDAGRELEPVILALGTWGQRWSRSRLARSELDVELLMLEFARNLDVKTLGLDPAVLALCISDLHGEARHWWLLVERAEVETCRSHPGRSPDVVFDGKSALSHPGLAWRLLPKRSRPQRKGERPRASAGDPTHRSMVGGFAAGPRGPRNLRTLRFLLKPSRYRSAFGPRFDGAHRAPAPPQLPTHTTSQRSPQHGLANLATAAQPAPSPRRAAMYSWV